MGFCKQDGNQQSEYMLTCRETLVTSCIARTLMAPRTSVLLSALVRSATSPKTHWINTVNNILFCNFLTSINNETQSKQKPGLSKTRSIKVVFSVFHYAGYDQALKKLFKYFCQQ